MIAEEFIPNFIAETRSLIDQMTAVLENAEAGKIQAKGLEDYGQFVDRIMGAAKTLAVNLSKPNDTILKISDYAALCKAVGYKASQIKDNDGFFGVCVALLLDATEVLSEMVNLLEQGKTINVKTMVSQTLIDRVRWVSSKFSAEYRASIPMSSKPAAVTEPEVQPPKAAKPKMNQTEIDELMSKLGV